MSLLRKAFVPFFVALMIVGMLLGGCAPKYRPVSLDITPVEETDPGWHFFRLLIRHLDEARGYPFARLYLDGHYRYVGWRATDDGRQVVYLFEYLYPDWLSSIPLLKYVYIYFDFRGTPRLEAYENVSINDNRINDGDGWFTGTRKLMIPGTRYCSGETKDIPEVLADEVHILNYSRIYSAQRGHIQRKYFTPAYCQGTGPQQGVPELAGIRFYFEDAQSMSEFASALVAAFPFIEVVESVPSPKR